MSAAVFSSVTDSVRAPLLYSILLDSTTSAARAPPRIHLALAADPLLYLRPGRRWSSECRPDEASETEDHIITLAAPASKAFILVRVGSSRSAVIRCRAGVRFKVARAPRLVRRRGG